jgi:hypothetical protein
MTVEADKFPQRKPVERMSDEEVRERLGRLADRINEGVATSSEIEEYNRDILPRWEAIESPVGIKP